MQVPSYVRPRPDTSRLSSPRATPRRSSICSPTPTRARGATSRPSTMACTAHGCTAHLGMDVLDSGVDSAMKLYAEVDQSPLGRRRPAQDDPSRHVGLHRHRRRGLLRDRVPRGLSSRTHRCCLAATCLRTASSRSNRTFPYAVPPSHCTRPTLMACTD
jgi:hypothetical protein